MRETWPGPVGAHVALHSTSKVLDTIYTYATAFITGMVALKGGYGCNGDIMGMADAAVISRPCISQSGRL